MRMITIVELREMLSEMAFGELQKVYWAIGWEMLIRTWWLYAVILIVVFGCVLAEVIQWWRMKRDG